MCPDDYVCFPVQLTASLKVDPPVVSCVQALEAAQQHSGCVLSGAVAVLQERGLGDGQQDLLYNAAALQLWILKCTQQVRGMWKAWMLHERCCWSAPEGQLAFLQEPVFVCPCYMHLLLCAPDLYPPCRFRRARAACVTSRASMLTTTTPATALVASPHPSTSQAWYWVAPRTCWSRHTHCAMLWSRG
jgi:hypothetical protein